MLLESRNRLQHQEERNRLDLEQRKRRWDNWMSEWEWETEQQSWIGRLVHGPPPMPEQARRCLEEERRYLESKGYFAKYNDANAGGSSSEA